MNLAWAKIKSFILKGYSRIRTMVIWDLAKTIYQFYFIFKNLNHG